MAPVDENLLAFRNVHPHQLPLRMAIRLRPSMYVGDVYERGVHAVVNDLVKDLLERGPRISLSSVTLVLRPDGSVTLSVEAARIFEAEDPQSGKPMHEWILGALDTDSVSTRSFASAGWSFPIANALSQWLSVELCGRDKSCRQDFQAGAATCPPMLHSAAGPPGLTLAFRLDPAIFGEQQLSFDRLRSQFRTFACLHDGVKLSITNEATAEKAEFQYADGIRAFVEFLNADRTPRHESIAVRGDEGGIRFAIGAQCCQERRSIVRSYVNDVETPDGGTHVTAMRSAWIDALKRFAQGNPLPTREVPRWTTSHTGLTAVVAVWMSNPQFYGAMRNKLMNPEPLNVLAAPLGAAIDEFLRQHPQTGTAIVQLLSARK